MATSFGWLSVLSKQGNSIIEPRTVVKCTWEQTFEGLLQHLDVVDENVEKVEILKELKKTYSIVYPLCFV